MILPMQIIRILGILLISLCPIFVSVYIYLSKYKRIKAIKNTRINLEKIMSLIHIKSGAFDDFDYNFLNEDEAFRLKNFHYSLTTSNSSLITDNCTRLINEFHKKEEKETKDFIQKGKMVISSGACIGIIAFVLLI